jgi:hypothetical protein
MRFIQKDSTEQAAFWLRPFAMIEGKRDTSDIVHGGVWGTTYPFCGSGTAIGPISIADWVIHKQDPASQRRDDGK